MKKLFNSVSPFIMLLIPVFIGIAILSNEAKTGIENDSDRTAIFYKIPRLETFFSFIF